MNNDIIFIELIITSDKIWVYQCEMLTKQYASEWCAGNEPKPKKRQIQSETKTLLTIFMDYRGVLHHEFRPEARSVNKE